MDSDVVFTILNVIFGVLVIFLIIMLPIDRIKKLKQIISLQDITITHLRDEVKVLSGGLCEKELYITRLVADNAVLKQRVVNLESELNSKLTPLEKIIKLYKDTGYIVHNVGDEAYATNNTDQPVKINKDGSVEYINLNSKHEEKNHFSNIDVSPEQIDDLFNKKALISQDQPAIKTERIASGVVSEEAPPDWATSFQMTTAPKCENKIIPSLQVYYDKAGEVKRKFPLTENDVFNDGVNSKNKTDDVIDKIRKNITSKKSCPGKCKEPKKLTPKKKQSTKKKQK